jgi:hypothetical protein
MFPAIAENIKTLNYSCLNYQNQTHTKINLPLTSNRLFLGIENTQARKFAQAVTKSIEASSSLSQTRKLPSPFKS